MLLRVEKTFEHENKEREQLAAGMPIDEVYKVFACSDRSADGSASILLEVNRGAPTPSWRSLFYQAGMTAAGYVKDVRVVIDRLLRDDHFVGAVHRCPVFGLRSKARIVAAGDLDAERVAR